MIHLRAHNWKSLSMSWVFDCLAVCRHSGDNIDPLTSYHTLSRFTFFAVRAMASCHISFSHIRCLTINIIWICKNNDNVLFEAFSPYWEMDRTAWPFHKCTLRLHRTSRYYFLPSHIAHTHSRRSVLPRCCWVWRASGWGLEIICVWIVAVCSGRKSTYRNVIRRT